MSEWKETTWGNVSILEYGKSLKNYQESSGTVPVFGTNGKIGFTDSQPLCKFPSVIIGRKGAYRGVHFSSIPFFVIDTAFYLKPIHENTIDLKFAYYKLLTQNINRLDSGSAIPSTSREDFYQLELLLPPLQEQKQIADILSCLDNKIDNLRHENETLEKIAQTLFKHWFINFEFPNDDGKPYKSSGGAMVASELGDIPAGWRVGTIGEIMTLNYGKSLITDNRVNGQYLVVGSSGVVGTHNEYLVKAPGIVIGRKGTIGKVIWLENNFYPIDTTFFVTDKLGCNDLYFHYFILKNQQFGRLISDSAVPGLNRDMAYSVEIIISNLSIINKEKTK